VETCESEEERCIHPRSVLALAMSVRSEPTNFVCGPKMTCQSDHQTTQNLPHLNKPKKFDRKSTNFSPKFPNCPLDHQPDQTLLFWRA